MGIAPLPLCAGRLPFMVKKACHKMPRHDRNENLFLIAWPFPAQNIL